MSSILNGINSHQIAPKSDITKQAVLPSEAHQNFADTLNKAIDSVNRAQVASDKKTEAMAKGQVDDLHDVMITAQKASVTLETSVQVQRKVIDAYNEVMRMQI